VTRPKILVLTGDAKTLIYHRGEILKEFANAGLEVVAAAAEDFGYVKDYLHSIGGRYEQVEMTRSSLNPLHDFKTLRSIQALLEREKPDYIFSYAIKSVIYGSIAASLAKVPHIYCLVPGLGYAFCPDGSWKQRLVCAASSLLYGVAFRSVDKVFLQNEDDRDLLRKFRILPRRTPSHVTLGSGVKLDQFEYRDIANEPAFKEGKLRFILVSRLLRKKGIAEYAEAAKLLKNRYPHIGFDLVGPLDPSPDGVTESEVRGWHEAGYITYHGETRDVPKYLRQAHAFVLPTYYREGVPRSVLEALSMGMPVITTDAPGSRETIRLTETGSLERAMNRGVCEGENGYLIRPRHLPSLLDAMERLILEPARIPAMGRAGRRMAETMFDVRAVNAGILREMGIKPAAADEAATEIRPAIAA